jgi:hypothetical protein
MAIITLEDLTKPLYAFSDDVNRAEQEMIANQDHYSRRNHIRALFAMIDGTIHIFRQTVLAGATEGQGQLSTQELSLLKKDQYPKYLKKYPRPAAKLLFTKEVLEKGFGYSLEFNLTPSNWEDFIAAVRLRNRIVHPNGLKEFEVSEEESELARRVSQWFDACVLDWLKQFIATHPVAKAIKDLQVEGDGNEYAM